MGTQLWPVSCRQEGMHPLVALPSTRHAHSATTLLVHVVWSTHRCAPWLDISFDPRLAELLARLAKRVGTETRPITSMSWLAIRRASPYPTSCRSSRALRRTPCAPRSLTRPDTCGKPATGPSRWAPSSCRRSSRHERASELRARPERQ